MDIVYTYKIPTYTIPNRDKYQKDWIEISSTSAKKVGYKTVLYTNDTSINTSSFLDEVIYIECNSRLWDSLKIKVLKTRQDSNYFLSDYDIIYSKKLNFEDEYDLFIDGFETSKVTWDLVYKHPSKVIEQNLKYNFWIAEQIPVTNIGILKFNSIQLKDKYIKCWKQLEKDTLTLNLDPNFLTATITQLLLSHLTQKYCIKKFTDKLGEFNGYYQHYIGVRKLKKLGTKVVI
jgi:hypothetical protein